MTVPAPTSVVSAPIVAMIGPPTSRPAELPAFVTTVCPDNNARRSGPDDSRAISWEIAAFPMATVRPAPAPSAAIAGGVVHSPMPTKHRPAQAQATASSGTGLMRRITASDTAEPISEPTPYPVMPAAR